MQRKENRKDQRQVKFHPLAKFIVRGFYAYRRTYSNVCPFDPGFTAPATSLHVRHTHTRLVRRSTHAGALMHPTHVACCTQATHVTPRVSTSGPIARSPNRESCHSAIGADLLQLRNYVLWTTLSDTFFIQNRQKEQQHPRQ